MLWEEKELQEEKEEVPCRYRRLSKSMEFLDNSLTMPCPRSASTLRFSVSQTRKLKGLINALQNPLKVLLDGHDAF